MKGAYSRTAEGMALLRAVEQHFPRGNRIIDDPYSLKYLQYPVFKLIARSKVISRLFIRFVNYWAPGALEFLTARARVCDDEARAMARDRLDQLVLLGAGFDTMALRLKDTLAQTVVYEVDHPATQDVKRNCATIAARITGVLPKATYVAVDFERDDFSIKLREAGPTAGLAFDPSRRSLIVWVGVSYYLTRQAVERTFGQIASISPRGSRLIFDYMIEDVIDGTSSDGEALAKARLVARIGEPWLYGIAPERVLEYLASFGFQLIKDYDADELRKMYGIEDRPRPISYVRIAVCEKE